MKKILKGSLLILLMSPLILGNINADEVEVTPEEVIITDENGEYVIPEEENKNQRAINYNEPITLEGLDGELGTRDDLLLSPKPIDEANIIRKYKRVNEDRYYYDVMLAAEITYPNNPDNTRKVTVSNANVYADGSIKFNNQCFVKLNPNGSIILSGADKTLNTSDDIEIIGDDAVISNEGNVVFQNGGFISGTTTQIPAKTRINQLGEIMEHPELTVTGVSGGWTEMKYNRAIIVKQTELDNILDILEIKVNAVEGMFNNATGEVTNYQGELNAKWEPTVEFSEDKNKLGLNLITISGRKLPSNTGEFVGTTAFKISFPVNVVEDTAFITDERLVALFIENRDVTITVTQADEINSWERMHALLGLSAVDVNNNPSEIWDNFVNDEKDRENFNNRVLGKYEILCVGLQPGQDVE